MNLFANYKISPLFFLFCFSLGEQNLKEFQRFHSMSNLSDGMLSILEPRLSLYYVYLLDDNIVFGLHNVQGIEKQST